MNDWHLIRSFVDHGSQEAFARLVEQYGNLVYSTCYREVGDHVLAEDVTQAVFLILASKAPTLAEATLLPGWLYKTSRFASRNALRQDNRRRIRERHMAEEMLRQAEHQEPAIDWSELEPRLHQAMASLSEADRNALMMRFWLNKSLREVGDALGTTEDSARKRVSRAVERLRHYFRRQGYAVPGAVLAGLLAEHTIRPASAACLWQAAQAPALLAKAGAAAAPAASSVAGAKVLRIYQEIERAHRIMTLKYAALGVAGALTTGVGTRAVLHHLAPPPARLPRVTVIAGQQSHRSAQATRPHHTPRLAAAAWSAPVLPVPAAAPPTAPAAPASGGVKTVPRTVPSTSPALRHAAAAHPVRRLAAVPQAPPSASAATAPPARLSPLPSAAARLSSAPAPATAAPLLAAASASPATPEPRISTVELAARAEEPAPAEIAAPQLEAPTDPGPDFPPGDGPGWGNPPPPRGPARLRGGRNGGRNGGFGGLRAGGFGGPRRPVGPGGFGAFGGRGGFGAFGGGPRGAGGWGLGGPGGPGGPPNNQFDRGFEGGFDAPPPPPNPE